MKKQRFTEEQIIGVLREQEAGAKVADLCRKHGISEATFYNWKARYGGMDVSEAKRLKALEEENAKLKKLLAEQMLAAAGPAPIASEALRRIAELYKVEDGIRGKTHEERCDMRQAKSRPIADNLAPWLTEQLALISQKTKLAEAIRYTLSRWDGLTRFIDDGRVEIDSNTVERSIRPIALNRKNALFAGSDAGAEHWATIASLIETAKLNGVEPMAYLTDVIAKVVNGHPNSQIDDLLPWAYANMPEAKAVA